MIDEYKTPLERASLSIHTLVELCAEWKEQKALKPKPQGTLVVFC
jgi:hypothetical protein